ncbi:MAG: hypothetical protein NDI81_05855 [Desulfobacula sp.]|nr:hypothetical protein [Desulfobacula sp.]
MVNFSMPSLQPPARSYQKRDLYRLLIARSDLNASLNACDLILKNVKSIKDENLYPLTTSVVVCYSRPFTANKPYGSLPKKWSKFDRQQYQDTHEKLLQARHELFAHSDMNVRKVQIVPPNVPLVIDEGRELKSPEISTQVSYILFEIDFFKIVRETNLDLGRRMQAEIDKMIIDLYGNMQLPNEAFNLRVDEGL